ncbi:hypothetical protein [Gorillibacterium sp. sgz5001074]|uniref:hypothetical protein n=1 Tax=Gorillibacterium sp. sgz5001074 TaxID=3446695 RepID=UPI003F6621CC
MLPIRPVRGLKRYEEHLDFYKFSMERRRAVREQEASGRQPHRRPSAFPYAKEAELHAAEDFAKTAAALWGAASALQGILEELDASRSTSVLHKRIAVSSEPVALTAVAEPGNPLRTERVMVRRLAARQVNRSALFVPDAPTVWEPGANRLELRTSAGTFECSVFVQPDDTHRKVLARLRDQIQLLRSIVKAALETDPSSGRIRLTLQSAEPGADNGFFLKDLAGNAAKSSGLLVMDQRAGNAELRLDGEDWMSHPSNRIPMPGKALLLQLHRQPESAVSLEILPDARSLDRKLRSLLHAINSLARAMGEAGDLLNPALSRYLTQAADNPTARETGFSRSEDGAWIWDAGYWDIALQEHYAKAVRPLTGPDSFLNTLRRLAAAMGSGPSESLLNRAHPRYMRYANYLATLEWYSQLPSKGLLLNQDY